MKGLIITGVLLLGLGAYILIAGLSVETDREVMRVGDVEASIEERRTIPPWVGGLGIVGGLLLIGAGLRRGQQGPMRRDR